MDHASWRWVFYVNLPVGAAALVALWAKLPAPRPDTPRHPLDVVGATNSWLATSAFMLACIWGGNRYDWGSAQILGLLAATLVLGVALVLRGRRVPDPIVPIGLLATPVVAVASASLFLGTAALFSIVVFVPMFLQAVAGVTPTEAGLLMVPMMAAVTLSTTLSGRAMARTGRYKRFPIAGLALMTAALVMLAALADERSVVATGAGLAVFGLGFGMVTQVLIVAVQNSVDRPRLGVATAATGFFRALGGAVGSAVLGAVFVAQAGVDVGTGRVDALSPAVRDSIADAVQTAWIVAAPLAALALLVVLRLPEKPLQERRA